MEDYAGYVACAVLVVLVLNWWPVDPAPFWLQACAVVLLCVINKATWNTVGTPRMSALGGIRNIVLGTAILLLVGLFDVVLGFIFGERTVVQAFLHSGPAGAPVDFFLAGVLVFVGLPTVVRSVFLYYAQPRP